MRPFTPTKIKNKIGTRRFRVKAKLDVAVKRILRKFGYPPDMQMLATVTDRNKQR